MVGGWRSAFLPHVRLGSHHATSACFFSSHNPVGDEMPLRRPEDLHQSVAHRFHPSNRRERPQDNLSAPRHGAPPSALGACRPALPDGRAGGGVRVRGGAGHPAGLGVGSRWYPRFRAAVCGVFGHGPGAAGFVQAVLGAGASGLPTPGGRERGSGSAGLRVRGADRSGGGRPRAAPGGGIDGRRATGRRRRLAGGLSALAEGASG